MNEGTVSVYRALDDGEPLQLLDPPPGVGLDGFAVSTAACDNPTCECTTMVLFIQPIRAAPDGTARLQGPELAGQASADGLRVVLDRPQRQPFTDQVIDWLERALREPPHQRWLAERWRRLRGQIGDRAYPSPIAPQQVEFLVPFYEVFPWDFDLTVVHDARKFLATDTYCMNPTCACDELAVHFFDTLAVGGPNSSMGHVTASLRRVRTPTVEGPAVLRELWDELLDQVGAKRLRDRFQRMRAVAKGRAVAPCQTPARNAPCPCGSGKKYKRCCGR